MYTICVSVDRDPFVLSGDVVFEETYGDPDLTGGVFTLPPYVKELNASIGEVTITDYIRSEFHDEFCALLVEAARDA